MIQCGRANDLSFSQVRQKYAGAVEHVKSVCVGVVASASTQMASESRERLLVQVGHGQVIPIGPVDEVLCCTEVSATGNHCIPHVRQGLPKALKQCAGRTLLKRANSPTRCEEF
jgi:hypothetical protein